MNSWLVTMGDFGAPHGGLAEIRWTGERLRLNEFRRFDLPLERCVAGKGFTGAQLLSDDALIVCGFNALYTIDLHEMQCEPWIISDEFNDLHDVVIEQAEKTVFILVANTGHDRVDVIDEAGEFVNTFTLSPWAGGLRPADQDPYFDAQADLALPVHLRKLRDLVHPNSVRRLGGHLWVSRFADRAVSRVSEPQRRVQFPSCPHDLVEWQDRCWNTTTDGLVWSFCPNSPGTEPRVEFDSYALSGKSGWVRGLALTDGLLLLGMTRISRMPRERWTDRPFSETETGILAIDPRTSDVLDWLSLEHVGEHPKVYSIIPRTRGHA